MMTQNESAALLVRNKHRGKISDYISARWALNITGSIGLFLIFAMRINLSVAIIAMVNNTFIDTHRYENVSNDFFKPNSNKIGQFNWDYFSQGIILGSFYWGYILTQLPGGRLAEVYSAKWTFGIGVLSTATLTLLTPFSAYQGWWIVAINRALQGCAQGTMLPAINVLIARWSPPNLRSQTSGFVFSGSLLGMAGGALLSGYLITNNIGDGWPSVFYVFGCIGVIWCILWLCIGFDSPDKHPWISEKEKSFLLLSFGNSQTEKKSMKFPYKSIISSLPMWAITVAHFGDSWGIYFLTAFLPLFLKDVLHYEGNVNSMRSSLPFFTCWIFILISTFVCDELIKSKYVSPTASRKFFNSIGFFIPTVLFFGVTCSGHNRELAYWLLLIGYTVNGAAYAGFNCNHVDLSPQFAGSLFGLTNTIATFAGIIAPTISGALLQQKNTNDQWFITFYLMSGIFFFTGIFYAVFASGEEQAWNKNDFHKNGNQSKKSLKPNESWRK